MLKIIYIITQSEWGGAQKNVLDLAVGLKNDYIVSVASGPDFLGWMDPSAGAAAAQPSPVPAPVPAGG